MSNLKEIKDAASRAFRDQQSQDTEGGVPDGMSFIAGFLEGYMHLKNAFDDRVKVIELQLEDKKKLEKEIAELKAKYETLDAHDEMLITTVDKLKQENKEMLEALKFTTKAAVHLFKPDKPIEKGLPPFWYHTTTYEGDVELIENTKLAINIITNKDLDKL
jgi:hypothetical protein